MKAYPDCNGDRVKTCPACNGDGVVDKDTDDERQCPTCGGLGFVPDDDDHEEVIKTSRCGQRDQTSEATMKSILGVSLLILLTTVILSIAGDNKRVTRSCRLSAPNKLSREIRVLSQLYDLVR